MFIRCWILVPILMGSLADLAIAQVEQDATAIADRYLAAMQRKGYKFLSKDELLRRRDQIASFTVKHLRKPLDAAARAAMLTGIDRCLDRLYDSPAGKVAYGNGFGSGGEEWMYLNDRDYFLTFQYYLWVGLTSRPLAPADVRRRDAQWQWMRQYLANRPIQANQEPPPLYGKRDDEIRSWAIVELEKALADPLNLLSVPMSDDGFNKLQERFKQFSNGISADIHDMQVEALGSRFPLRQDTAGRYEYTNIRQLPFDDTMVQIWGNGPSLHFASNAEFRGGYGILSPSVVYDVVRGTEMRPERPDPASMVPGPAMEAWLAGKGQGDLTLDHSTLVAVRGAKMAYLPVKNWFEADGLSDDQLRAAIRTGGRDRISIGGLPPMNGVVLEDRSRGEFFAVVQTRENRLAVINAHNYEFGQLEFWRRHRAKKPIDVATPAAWP